MQRQALKQLNDAIAYLEENLCGDISMDTMAKLAGVTQDSFLRFFSYMTGMTLAEYLRKRRLTLAGHDLQQSGMRVIDIALKYGYENEDAFRRAFRKQHGVTPVQARDSHVSLKAYSPVSFHITIKGAKEMDIRMITLEETKVYGISKPFDQKEYGSRESLRHFLWDEREYGAPKKISGSSWNEPGNTDYDGIWYGIWHNGEYWIAREGKDVKAKKENLKCFSVPAGLYAAFRTPPGGLAWEELPKLFEEIFDSWLPASPYQRVNDTIVEIYHLWTNHELRRKNRYYEVLIPIEEKQEK